MKTFIALQIVAACLAVSLLTGCGNTRLYIGVDDYGEAQQFHHDFTTRGNGDDARAKGVKY